MGAKISKKKGTYDATKAQKKVELIKHIDLPHSYFYKAPDRNLITLRSKYKPQYLSQQFEVERNEPPQRHAQSYMDVREDEYNLYEEIPVRELPSPQPEVVYTPQISVESQEYEDNYNSSDIEKEVESDHANEQTPEQQLLEIVDKLKVVKKRIKKFDGNDNSDEIRADLAQHIAELSAVESTKPTLMELRAALITKSEHFMQALAEKEAKLRPVKLAEVEKPTKAYQQVVFDIFAQLTADLDILKENIIDYYGTTEGPECTRIGSRLDECIEIVKSVDPKGDFRIVVAKEEYEDYISRLQAQFNKIVSENEKTFLIDKKTLSTVAKRDNRRKRSQIYFPESDGKFQIPQIDITGGQYGLNARENEKSLVSDTEKVYYKNVDSVEELVNKEDGYNSDTANVEEEGEEIYNFASQKSPTDENEAEVYNFANVTKAKVYERLPEENEVEAEEYNFVRQNKVLENNQFPNTPEIKVDDYQNLTEHNPLYQNQTMDISLNCEDYNFVRQNNMPEEPQYPDIQEMKTNDNQSVPVKEEDTNMLNPNTQDVANSRFNLRRQLSRQASTRTETTDDEFYDCFDDIPLVSDLDSPDEEFQDSQDFQGSRPQSGFAEIFGGLGASLPQQSDSDCDDQNCLEVAVNYENLTQEETNEGFNAKRVSLTESVLFETQFICQYFIQVERQAALEEIKLWKGTTSQYESSARAEKSYENQLDQPTSQESESYTDDTSFNSKRATLTQDNTNETTILKRTSIIESNLFKLQLICLQFIQSERQAALEDIKINNYSNETTDHQKENQPDYRATQEDEYNSLQLFQTVNPLYKSENNAQSNESDINTEDGIISNIEDKEMGTGSTWQQNVQLLKDLNFKEFGENVVVSENVDQSDEPSGESDKSAYVIEINIPEEEKNIKTSSIGAPFIETSVEEELHQTSDDEEIKTPISTHNTKESGLLLNNGNMDQFLTGENESEDDDQSGRVEIGDISDLEANKEQAQEHRNEYDNKFMTNVDRLFRTYGPIDKENDIGSVKDEPIQSLEVYADKNILIEVNVPRTRERYPSECEICDSVDSSFEYSENSANTTVGIDVEEATPETEDTVHITTHNEKQDPHLIISEHKMHKSKSERGDSSVQKTEQAIIAEENNEGKEIIFLDQGKSKISSNGTSGTESDWHKIFSIKSCSSKSNSTSQTFPSNEEGKLMQTEKFIEDYQDKKVAYSDKNDDQMQEEILSQTEKGLPFSQTEDDPSQEKPLGLNQYVVKESSMFDIDTTLVSNAVSEEPFSSLNEETEDLLVSKEQMCNDPTYLPTYKQALNLQNNKPHTESSSSSLLDVYQDNRVSSPSLRKLDVIAEDDISETHSSNRVTNLGDSTLENDTLIVNAQKLEDVRSDESNNDIDRKPEHSTRGRDIEDLDVEVINRKYGNSLLEHNTQESETLASESTVKPRSHLLNTANSFDLDEKETNEDSVIQHLQKERKLSYRQTRIKLPTISKQTSDQSEDLSEEERDTLADLPPTETPWLQEIETVEECVEDMKLCIRDFEGTPKDEIYLNIYENLFNCMSILNKVKSSNVIIIGRKQTILREIRSCMQQLEVKAG